MLILSETAGALGESKRYIDPDRIEALEPTPEMGTVVIMASGARYVVIENQTSVAQLKAAWKKGNPQAYAVQWIGKVSWVLSQTR
jgi:uncharacterized protein YlzI (FlbEa/FlbD family)